MNVFHNAASVKGYCCVLLSQKYVLIGLTFVITLPQGRPDTLFVIQQTVFYYRYLHSCT